MIFALVGCGSSSDNSTGTTNSGTAVADSSNDNDAVSTDSGTAAADNGTSANNSEPEKTYQSILDDYSQKIREATPGLIEEYNQLAAENTEGIEGLAKLSNQQIEKLAKISNAGVEEMASLMMVSGSGSYEEYETWAQKLVDVYMEEGKKITDAYMASAA
jgi:LAS superfamily LD-carboxypeptidase LdcB